jgi:hypothetical protein
MLSRDGMTISMTRAGHTVKTECPGVMSAHAVFRSDSMLGARDPQTSEPTCRQ